MDDRFFERLRRVFFPVIIGSLLLLLLLVWLLLGPVIALKGGYALLGTCLAGGIFYFSKECPEEEHHSAVSPFYWKSSIILSLAALPVAYLVESRLLVLLVFVPVIATLLAIQVNSGAPASTLLPQLVVFFAVGPLSKYLSTGMYFGNGDTLRHVRFVEVLVQSTVAFPMEQYFYFPVLHVLTGILSLVFGASAYDALMILGIVTFSIFVPLGYLLALRFLDDKQSAVLVAFGLVLLEPISFYASYFFPQSLAVVLSFYLIYIIYQIGSSQFQRRRLYVLWSIFGLTLVFTHHFTFVLMTPIVLVLVSYDWVLEKIPTVSISTSSLVSFRVLPFLIVGLTAISHWSFLGEFIPALAYVVLQSAGSLFASTEGTRVPIRSFGQSLEPISPLLSLQSLGTPEGVYYILLLALFLLGVVQLFSSWNRFKRATPAFVLGVSSVVLVLRTPIAVPGIDRIRFPLSVFFAFVIGLGIYFLVQRTVFSQHGRTMLVVVLVVLSTNAVIVAGDDIDSVQSGAGLTELYPVPGLQNQYTDTEYRMMSSASSFVKKRDADVTTLWLSRWTLERFGASSRSPTSLTPNGVVVDRGVFLYRTNWLNYQIIYKDGQSLTSIVMEETWLRNAVEAQNKVYDNGKVGMTWTANQTVFTSTSRVNSTGDSVSESRIDNKFS